MSRSYHQSKSRSFILGKKTTKFKNKYKKAAERMDEMKNITTFLFINLLTKEDEFDPFFTKIREMTVLTKKRIDSKSE